MDIVIRFDELFLKGSNQSFFIKKMKKNLESLFPGVEAKRTEGGLLLFNFSENPEEFKRLSLVPGIAKLAQCLVCDSSLEQISKTLLNKNYPANIKSFRITASRSYKNFPLNSNELNIKLGSLLVEKNNWKVELKNPDLNIYLDVGKDRVIIFENPIDGAGGLPTGTAGRIMVLLSGGIDSPVAAYSLMKRGAEISLVHFQNETMVSEEVGAKIFDLAKNLSKFQPRIKLIMVPFAEYQKEIIKKIPADHRMIASRRVMFLLAEKIALKNKAEAVATGDSLAQVASQTLRNMSVIYKAGNMLKVSPLVGYNKLEITKIARNIGTLQISERPYEDCCSLFVARHPETKASLDRVEKMEKNLDFSGFDKPRFISYNISII